MRLTAHVKTSSTLHRLWKDHRRLTPTLHGARFAFKAGRYVADVVPDDSAELLQRNPAVVVEIMAPVAARDVPPGTSWAFTEHRTMADVMRGEIPPTATAAPLVPPATAAPLVPPATAAPLVPPATAAPRLDDESLTVEDLLSESTSAPAASMLDRSVAQRQAGRQSRRR
jgi:hypothetical protein